MKYIKLVAVIGVVSLLVTSCSKKSKLGKLIPKNAAIAIDINTKSLLSKLPWDEIKKTYWFNEALSDSSFSATAKTYLTDPAKTGIDLESDLIFFLVTPDNNGHMVFEGSIKDSKQFADFVTGMHPKATATKDGDINLLKGEDVALGWNNERFIVVAGADRHRFEKEIINDSTFTVTDSAKQTPPLTEAVSVDLVKICKDLFALSSDNSLHDNEKFADLEDEKGDVHFWMNTGALYQNSMKNMPAAFGMMNLKKFIEDSRSTATINFEDGKVSGTFKQYFAKELSDILKKGEDDLNTDMIKRISSQNIAGIYSIHFTPGHLLEIIKLMGLDGVINFFLASQGVTLDDIVKATNGDMLFAVTDVTMKDDTANIKGVPDTVKGLYPSKPSATFLFSVGIGDKKAFNKILKLTDNLRKDMGQHSIAQKSDDKYFAAGNSPDAVNKYFSGTKTDHAFLSKISDYPMGGYVDLQMILKAFQGEFTKDSIGKAHYERNIAIWHSAYFYGGEYKDGGIVSNGELNFVDKNTNSLKQLNKYIDENAQVIIEKRKKQKEEWKANGFPELKVDSVVVNKKPGRKAKK